MLFDSAGGGAPLWWLTGKALWLRRWIAHAVAAAPGAVARIYVAGLILFIGASLAAGFAVARLGKIVAADMSRDDLPTMPEVGHGGR